MRNFQSVNGLPSRPARSWFEEDRTAVEDRDHDGGRGEERGKRDHQGDRADDVDHALDHRVDGPALGQDELQRPRGARRVIWGNLAEDRLVEILHGDDRHAAGHRGDEDVARRLPVLVDPRGVGHDDVDPGPLPWADREAGLLGVVRHALLELHQMVGVAEEHEALLEKVEIQQPEPDAAPAEHEDVGDRDGEDQVRLRMHHRAERVEVGGSEHRARGGREQQIADQRHVLPHEAQLVEADRVHRGEPGQEEGEEHRRRREAGGLRLARQERGEQRGVEDDEIHDRREKPAPSAAARDAGHRASGRSAQDLFMTKV